MKLFQKSIANKIKSAVVVSVISATCFGPVAFASSVDFSAKAMATKAFKTCENRAIDFVEKDNKMEFRKPRITAVYDILDEEEFKDFAETSRRGCFINFYCNNTTEAFYKDKIEETVHEMRKMVRKPEFKSINFPSEVTFVLINLDKFDNPSIFGTIDGIVCDFYIKGKFIMRFSIQDHQ